MREAWSKMDTTTKLSIGCGALYLSLYVVVDIAQAIAEWIVWVLA